MADPKVLQCPAAPQDWKGAVVFGVFVEGQVVPVEPTLVNPALLELCTPQTPRQVLRMAATCVKSACRHWNAQEPGAQGDGVCTLAQRVLAAHPPVSTVLLPACGIRSTCRWFAQLGRAACFPCHLTPTDLGVLPQDAARDKDVTFF